MKTRVLPCASTYRYGFSREAGVCASVVYTPPAPKFWAGAPFTPANTWFHTPFDQSVRALSRTRNCCWLPLMTLPRLESAMNPPLAYCGPAVQ